MSQSLARWLGMTLETGSQVIVVEILEVKGSTPRDTDAFMMVSRDAIRGTIGGGVLEWTAIEHAREMIQRNESTGKLSLPLGPYLGQCCGGHVTLEFYKADHQIVHFLEEREETERTCFPRLLIFGAGHVGRAIAQAFKPLPFAMTVLDTRASEIAALPAVVDSQVTENPVANVESAAQGTSFIVLTHSHTMDFLITEAALKRSDAAYVGMIGSATKRAKFRSWLVSRGTDVVLMNRLVCPIGGTRVRDKRPEIIAALVASELIAKVLSNVVVTERSFVPVNGRRIGVGN